MGITWRGYGVATQFPGARRGTLVGYLKGLGVLRACARHIDPDALSRWADDVPRPGAIEIALPGDEILGMLLTGYEPSPVLSPWNRGSGWWGNTTTLDWLRESTDVRLSSFRAAAAATTSVLARLSLHEPPSTEEKPGVVAALAAWLPDDALDWLNAAVPRGGDGRQFEYNPLFGSGGNDGRYDISVNYLQAIRYTLEHPDRSVELLRGALLETPAQLVPMSLGQWMRDRSPSASPEGAPLPLGNPWELILAVEGSLMLAASTSRRLRRPKLPVVAPWVFRSTPVGYGGAAHDEDVRCEVWAPCWHDWLGHRHVSEMLAAGDVRTASSVSEMLAAGDVIRTASFARLRPAATGLDVMRAAGDRGLDPGIDSLDRYIVAQRAGQAYSTIPANSW